MVYAHMHPECRSSAIRHTTERMLSRWDRVIGADGEGAASARAPNLHAEHRSTPQAVPQDPLLFVSGHAMNSDTHNPPRHQDQPNGSCRVSELMRG